MIKLFHYLHTKTPCEGYNNYLKKAQYGNFLQFNWRFFLFQGFYLIYLKMYRETFMYTFLIGLLIGLMSYNTVIFGSLFLVFILVSNFSFYKIYELRNERLLYNTCYNPNLFLNKVNPFNTFFSLSIMFLMCFPLVYALLIGIWFGLDGQSKEHIIKKYEASYVKQN